MSNLEPEMSNDEPFAEADFGMVIFRSS